MEAVLKATEVRKNWGQFNDDIVRKGPQFVKRNRDEWAALSKEQLRAAFENFTFEINYLEEADGTLTAALNDFDIVENGNTEEEVKQLIAEELVEYAEDYLNNFTLYFKSPNRHQHFPYVMNVSIQDDIEGVKKLITCHHGEK